MLYRRTVSSFYLCTYTYTGVAVLRKSGTVGKLRRFLYLGLLTQETCLYIFIAVLILFSALGFCVGCSRRTQSGVFCKVYKDFSEGFLLHSKLSVVNETVRSQKSDFALIIKWPQCSFHFCKSWQAAPSYYTPKQFLLSCQVAYLNTYIVARQR